MKGTVLKMVGTGKDFSKFAGNSELASGIAAGIPIANLESVGGTNSDTIIKNLMVVDSIMPAKSATIFMEPRIFTDYFDWIPRSSEPYGAFTEMAMFKNFPPTKLRSGKCISYGDAQLYAERWVTNWAYNISMSIKDREINRGVMNESQAEMYYAGKMKTPINTMRLERFARWKQLFADVMDGTRSISSTTSSDGEGDARTYNVNVTGYAGIVDELDTVMPALTYGSKFEFDPATGDADILEILDNFKNAMTWSEFPSNQYAKGLVNEDEMVIGGNYALIMEKAVLDAMDSMWVMSPEYKGISKSARQYARDFLGAGGRLVEIDQWPALPTSIESSGKRLVGTLIDTEAPREFVAWEDVRAQYCMEPRLTSWNWQGEGSAGIFRGLPAYAQIAPVA